MDVTFKRMLEEVHKNYKEDCGQTLLLTEDVQINVLVISVLVQANVGVMLDTFVMITVVLVVVGIHTVQLWVQKVLFVTHRQVLLQQLTHQLRTQQKHLQFLAIQQDFVGIQTSTVKWKLQDLQDVRQSASITVCVLLLELVVVVVYVGGGKVSINGLEWVVMLPKFKVVVVYVVIWAEAVHSELSTKLVANT